VHLHHFSKIESHKKSQNSRNQGFSYFICLMIVGTRSGSVPLTNGSRSRSPKIIRIRIPNTGYAACSTCRYQQHEGHVCPRKIRSKINRTSHESYLSLSLASVYQVEVTTPNGRYVRVEKRYSAFLSLHKVINRLFHFFSISRSCQ
jgi:hypothetical protein